MRLRLSDIALYLYLLYYYFMQTPAQPNLESWGKDDSPFSNYVDLVEFEGGSAINLIEGAVGHSALNTAIDIAGGSNGRAIHDLLNSGAIGSGIFTNYIDNRDGNLSDRRVQFVDGDLLDDTTWRRITAAQKAIAPAGLDLALHRPYGGLQDLSVEQYYDLLTKTMGLLRGGGVLYTQIPQSAYEGLSKGELERLCRLVHASSSVGKVATSVASKTLSDYNFALIYKEE